jgi:hypothetical protein
MPQAPNKTTQNIQQFSNLIRQGGDNAVKAMSMFMDRTGKVMQKMAPQAQATGVAPAPQAAAPAPQAAAPAAKPAKVATNRPVGLANGTEGSMSIADKGAQQGVTPKPAPAGYDPGDTMAIQANPNEQLTPPGGFNFGPREVELVGVETFANLKQLIAKQVAGGGAVTIPDALAKLNAKVQSDMDKEQEIRAQSQENKHQTIAGAAGASGGKTPSLGGPSASPGGVATPRPVPGAPALPQQAQNNPPPQRSQIKPGLLA